MQRLIADLAIGAVEFSFWSAVLFMVGYTILAPWWKSQIGWARISLDFALALALSPTILHYAFGVKVANSTGFAFYTIGAIFLVGCVSLWNFALVVRAQLKGHIKGHWRKP